MTDHEEFEKWSESRTEKSGYNLAWFAWKARGELERLKVETQTPVARINLNKRRLEFVIPMDWSNLSTVAYLPDIPLFATPPSREWVGLSNEEIEEATGMQNQGFGSTYYMVARAIEAKLREKNG